MGSPQKPRTARQGGNEEKNQTQETHQEHMETLVFSPQDGFSVCSPSQHSRHCWTGSQLLQGKAGAGAGATGRACSPQPAPCSPDGAAQSSALDRVGRALREPPLQHHSSQRLHRAFHPFASTPKATLSSSTTGQGRNSADLSKEETPAQPECWDGSSALLYL